MQLTINLLKQTTIFILLCFVLQEVISMVCILIASIFLLDDNEPNVDSASLIQLQEISNSFNAIIIRQLNSIQSDLFLVYNHSRINTITTFVTNSEFNKALTNVMIKHSAFQSHPAYTTYANTDAISPNEFMLLKHLKSKYESDNSIDEIQHINGLFAEIGLKFVTYYSDIALTAGGGHEKSISYIIGILKALAIRDLNLKKTPNEYSIITKDFYSHYPPKLIEFNKGLNNIFYNASLSICSIQYLPECLTYFKEIPLFNGQIYDNTVYFNHPKLFQSKTIGQACINLPFNPDPPNFKSVICSSFKLTPISFDIHLLNHAIDFALITIHEINAHHDIELLYLIGDIYDKIKVPFSSNLYKQYALNKTQSSYSLFHLLYYHLLEYIDPVSNQEFIDSIIEEYEQNIKTILSELKSYLNDIKGKDFIDNKPFIFNISQTYISYSRTQEGELYHSNKNHYKDIFHYIITPIVLSTSNEKANTNRFVFFSFVVNRNEITVKKNSLYHLIAIKAVNYFIFGVFLILFVVLLFYFTFELYVNSLLSPIRKYKEDLLAILNNIPAYMKWTAQVNSHKDKGNKRGKDKSNNNSQHSQDNLQDSIESKTFSLENNSDISQYQNVETKEVEYSIVFLKRILLMKYSDHIKYEEKSNIYKESLIHLQKYPIEYIKCSFIVAINLFKSRKYPQAIEKLNDICIKLRSQIAKISINEDVKVSSNLSAEYQCYINEFFNLSGVLNPSARLSFNLHMLFQNCFYIIGLVDWVWFKEVKAMNKPKESEGNNISCGLDPNKKNDMTQIDYFLIDKGIKAFTNAIEINHLMKANLLKNIWLNIMISKCEYEKEQYQKSNWHLQEAFVGVMDFNNYLINSSLSASEKTVILINGILLQYILYHFGKLLTKMKKYKSAGEVFTQCLEISLFKIEIIQSNCFIKIGKLLKGKQMKNESKVIKKITQRLNPDYFELHAKAIVILTSFEFINSYELIEELKDALMKYTSKFFNEENDYIGYIEVGVNQTKTINLSSNAVFCEEFQRKYEVNQIFTIDNSFNTQFRSEGNNNSNSNNTLSKEKASFDYSSSEFLFSPIYQGMLKAIAMLDEFDTKIPQHRYVFLFGMSKFIDLYESEQWIKVRNTLHEENISLYVFCFESEIPEFQRGNIVSYLKKKNLIEGILFKVISFKIIKKAFQNITTQGNKRVFRVCFKDVENIY